MQWARTVRWFRIVEHLEGDLETSTTDESAKRQVLFQKLDILRPVFQSQLRVAEAGLLEIRGMDDDALWPENSEERNSFQIKGYLHALKVVKLFTILEEIDELGDDDDIDATDLRYADLEREKEVLRGEIKELEDEIGRSEEDEDRRSSSESLQTATEIVSRVM